MTIKKISIQKKEIKISGMTCNHCVRTIESELSQISGIKSVKVNLNKNIAMVDFDSKIILLEEIHSNIKNLGYKVDTK